MDAVVSGVGCDAGARGILIILQTWRPVQAAQEIVQFLAGRTSLPNAIYGYDFDPKTTGWVQNPVPKRR